MSPISQAIQPERECINLFIKKKTIISYRLKEPQGEWNIIDLIGLAVALLVLALIAYVLGARGIAGFSMEIARWLVIIFVILAIISFFYGRI